MNIDPRFLRDAGREIFTGNELLVKGALETEGGVHLLTGYPGSPIAGFFDTLSSIGPLLNEKGVVAKIANNEALSVAMVNGAQMVGCRAITVFK
jgi:indolepyruvate ferredoxin oxidoreductase